MKLKEIVERLSLEWEKDPNGSAFIEALQELQEYAEAL